MDRLAAARANRTPQNYELSNFSNGAESAAHAQSGALGPFFQQLDAIQSLISTIIKTTREIESIHARLLGPLTPSETSHESARLQESTEYVQKLSKEIKEKIKQLSAGDLSRYSLQDRRAMKDQAGRVRQRFVEALRSYQSVEQAFQSKSKQRIERGFKVLHPNASATEVKEFVDGQSQVQLLQGVSASSDYANARATANEVQQRQYELVRLERTLAELAQLFNDMAYLVQEQDQTFDNIQTQAIDVEGQVKQGAEYTDTAVKHARNARKMRWICFWIIVVLILILAVVLGLYFGLPAWRASRQAKN